MTAPSDPLVVQVVRDFRAGLISREEAQVNAMTNRWLSVVDSLEGAIAALAFEIGEIDPPVTEWKLFQLGRYQSLLAQTERQIARFNNFAAQSITDEQAGYAQLGLEVGTEAITASYMQAGVVVGAFDLLPVEAVETMVGLAGDGSPLSNLLNQSFPLVAKEITDELIRSVAIGINPRETARRLRDRLNIALQRALVIARTEQLRAYRQATRLQYLNSGVVSGYKRISARDLRVCLACLLLDGKTYRLDVEFEEHPNGRCAMVPIVNDMPPIEWQNGKSWLTGLDEASQRGIMGNGHFEAWKAGKFALDDVVGIRRNATWGNAPFIRPLKSLIG